MEARRPHGTETWHRLLDWDKGASAAERLVGSLLMSEGYEVNPAHPLGGRDGGCDASLKKDGVELILAVYFPRKQKSISSIKKKFLSDLRKIDRKVASGFVFVTNQELKISERSMFQSLSGGLPVEIYHLERLRNIIDSPQNYGIRLEYLQIPITIEEQLSLYADRDKAYQQRLENLLQNLSDVADRIEGLVTGRGTYPEVIASVDFIWLNIKGQYPLRDVHITVTDQLKIQEELNNNLGSIENIFRFKQQCIVGSQRESYIHSNNAYPLNCGIFRGRFKAHYIIDVRSLAGSHQIRFYAFQKAEMVKWCFVTFGPSYEIIVAKDQNGNEFIFDLQKGIPLKWSEWENYSKI